MQLTLNQMKEITWGAVSVHEENDSFNFNRFTAEEKNLYQNRKQLFYDRTFTSAGIRLVFKTDSKNLFLKIKTSYVPSRQYFSLDVYVNEKCIGYIDNFSDVELEREYTQQSFPQGEFSKTFALGDGEKTVCMYLPWSVRTCIAEISIDDNAFVEGVKPKKKLLAFGDSITQGYDALRSSARYIARLADRLGAEEMNKGIGGETFFPALAACKNAFMPDYITVAYGTNDWNGTDAETFKNTCKTFFANLTENYPDAKIFAITPIWRKDLAEYREFGPFDTVEKYIRELVGNEKNITVIPGFDFVPKEEKYFADFRLHPNDDGFSHYANNLYNAIGAYI